MIEISIRKGETDGENLFSREPQLFNMHEHVSGIGINAKRPSPLQFFPAVTARQETYA